MEIVGVVLIALGALVLLGSFVRFAIKGLGHARARFSDQAPGRHRPLSLRPHPMYVAVASLIFGQGLIFGNLRVLEYGVLIWLAFHLFVIVYEEPTLRASFGAEYQSFCREVSRWIPQLRFWGGVPRATAGISRTTCPYFSSTLSSRRMLALLALALPYWDVMTCHPAKTNKIPSPLAVRQRSYDSKTV